MGLTKQQLRFDGGIKEFVGFQLLQVEYLEIDYQPNNPKHFYNTVHNEIDSIDFSIFFHTDKGRIEFFWDSQFYSYGIGYQLNSIVDSAEGRKWDVSEDEIWKGVIGQKILDIVVNWDTISTFEKNGELKKSYYYPQSLQIKFVSDKSIFISAAEFLNENDVEVIGFQDNLLVTNNYQLGKKVKMI